MFSVLWPFNMRQSVKMKKNRGVARVLSFPKEEKAWTHHSKRAREMKIFVC